MYEFMSEQEIKACLKCLGNLGMETTTENVRNQSIGNWLSINEWGGVTYAHYYDYVLESVVRVDTMETLQGDDLEAYLNIFEED